MNLEGGSGSGGYACMRGNTDVLLMRTPPSDLICGLKKILGKIKFNVRLKRMFLFKSCALFFTLSTLAWAARFANQFTEFELPPQWQCGLEGAEWICQNSDDRHKKEAIIVLAAKLMGPQDTLDQYLAYLKAPKSYQSLDGQTIQSEPKYAQNRELGGHPWVDSLHLESEIPGFYTRYLATVIQDIGVLITYSIQKEKYTDYTDVFENLIKTLKVFRRSGGLNAGSRSSQLFQNIQVPNQVGTETLFPSDPGANDKKISGKSSHASSLPDWMLMLVIGGIGVLWVLWKKKKSTRS